VQDGNTENRLDKLEFFIIFFQLVIFEKSRSSEFKLNHRLSCFINDLGTAFFYIDRKNSIHAHKFFQTSRQYIQQEQSEKNVGHFNLVSL